jgi:hypothetical protein
MSTHEASGGHDEHAFEGEPVAALAADEPRTPGWLPALGAALFVAAAVWFLAISKGDDAAAAAVASASASAPVAEVTAQPAPPPPAPPSPAREPFRRAEPHPVAFDSAKPAAPPAPGNSALPLQIEKIRQKLRDKGGH